MRIGRSCLPSSRLRCYCGSSLHAPLSRSVRVARRCSARHRRLPCCAPTSAPPSSFLFNVLSSIVSFLSVNLSLIKTFFSAMFFQQKRLQICSPSCLSENDGGFFYCPGFLLAKVGASKARLRRDARFWCKGFTCARFELALLMLDTQRYVRPVLTVGGGSFCLLPSLPSRASNY